MKYGTILYNVTVIFFAMATYGNVYAIFLAPVTKYVYLISDHVII